MSYHRNFYTTDPISGHVAGCCIIGNPERTREGIAFKPDVSIDVRASGISFHMRMTPDDARHLAESLALAAEVAAAPPAAALPFTLVAVA